MDPTDKKYIKFTFSSSWDNDMLVALLTNFSFDSFEEDHNNVIAYLPADQTDKLFFETLEQFCKKYSINFHTESFENRNWNADWEANYKPVEIGDFCIIQADFHNIDQKKYKYSIIVNPEMTFGTGHHETTRMMIKLMSEINFSDLKVVDFGSGTGILAIFAEMLGAKKILAIDNDPLSVRNIMENAVKNKCNKIISELGDTLSVEQFSFDIILANIERNVLMKEAQNISNSVHKGGFVLLSGILAKDQYTIIETFENHSFKHMKTIQDGEWTAMKFIAF